MVRRLFTLLSALSLLLCAASAVLWVRSYNIGDHFHLRTPSNPHTLCRLHAGFGRMSFGLIRYDARRALRPEDEPVVRYWAGFPFALTELKPQSQLGRLGFAYREWYSGHAGGSTVRWVVVPSWVVVTTALLLPVAWALSMLRRHRARSLGLCQQCGYDLRATPGRCPECGSAAAGKAA